MSTQHQQALSPNGYRLLAIAVHDMPPEALTLLWMYRVKSPNVLALNMPVMEGYGFPCFRGSHFLLDLFHEITWNITIHHNVRELAKTSGF
ncbi:hypothetical protein TNCV_4470001 [Trichonephila clavipes]|nr:hypothetical protein TNCV_4470001 [Trichonephila clavipes]